jgi:RNA polymerase sigma factor (sigma-70 family)
MALRNSEPPPIESGSTGGLMLPPASVGAIPELGPYELGILRTKLLALLERTFRSEVARLCALCSSSAEVRLPYLNFLANLILHSRERLSSLVDQVESELCPEVQPLLLTALQRVCPDPAMVTDLAVNVLARLGPCCDDEEDACSTRPPWAVGLDRTTAPRGQRGLRHSLRHFAAALLDGHLRAAISFHRLERRFGNGGKDDVRQSTLFLIGEKCRAVRGIKSVVRFAQKVAHRLAIQMGKRSEEQRERDERFQNDVFDWQQAKQDFSYPGEAPWAEQRLVAAIAAVSSMLNERERAVIRLHLIEKLPFKTVAEAARCSHSAAGKALERARKKAERVVPELRVTSVGKPRSPKAGRKTTASRERPADLLLVAAIARELPVANLPRSYDVH